MAQPYVGEIRMFAGSFAPDGWRFCDGQPLSISENEVLFQLIGTVYGGDGETTFALPDLRGRIPVHQGNGFIMGETGGAEEVTLTVNAIPAHSHSLVSGGAAVTRAAANRVLARASGDIYCEDASVAALSPQAISAVGGSQPHTNLQPFLCINFIISLHGIFPSPQ